MSVFVRFWGLSLVEKRGRMGERQRDETIRNVSICVYVSKISAIGTELSETSRGLSFF